MSEREKKKWKIKGESHTCLSGPKWEGTIKPRMAKEWQRMQKTWTWNEVEKRDREDEKVSSAGMEREEGNHGRTGRMDSWTDVLLLLLLRRLVVCRTYSGNITFRGAVPFRTCKKKDLDRSSKWEHFRTYLTLMPSKI